MKKKKTYVSFSWMQSVEHFEEIATREEAPGEFIP